MPDGSGSDPGGNALPRTEPISEAEKVGIVDRALVLIAGDQPGQAFALLSPLMEEEPRPDLFWLALSRCSRPAMGSDFSFSCLKHFADHLRHVQEELLGVWGPGRFADEMFSRRKVLDGEWADVSVAIDRWGAGDDDGAIATLAGVIRRGIGSLGRLGYPVVLPADGSLA